MDTSTAPAPQPPAETADHLLEHDLAKKWRVAREVLARLRAATLVEGTDWHRTPRGITLTLSASQKMRAAAGLAAPEPATAEVTVEVTVAMVLGPRHIRGRMADGRLVKALIESRPGGGMAPTSTLQQHQELRGCRWMNPDLLSYNGPLPRRRGQSVPVITEKKEGAL
jgi:hypothetical protein